MKKLKVLFLMCMMVCIYPISMYALNSSYNLTLIVKPVDMVISTSNATYLDPLMEMKWGFYTVGADIAHANGIDGTNSSNASHPVVVAVIDTGVDYDHPDLNDSYLAGGYDFVNDDDDPMDDNGHGTHCAGIIAAEMNNSIGVVGIAPKAKIMAYKVLNENGAGYMHHVTDAINHICDNHPPSNIYGVDIISLSLGQRVPDFDVTGLQNAINRAVGEGIIIVAATGNEDGPVLYPAKMKNVTAIGATDVLQHKASYSNYGPEINYTAPGGDWHFFGFVFVGILSTWRNNKYAYAAGTSMATPMVAGVIALLLGTGVDPADIHDELNSPSRIKDLGAPGWDPYFGNGLVRIFANNWDYRGWYHKHFDDDILMATLLMIGPFLIPEPQIDWVTWAIIGGVIVFFAVIAIYEARAAK
ncbi:MAG: S8 family serine peptidase [Candidatus Hodarchaeota archaeon]